MLYAIIVILGLYALRPIFSILWGVILSIISFFFRLFSELPKKLDTKIGKLVSKGDWKGYIGMPLIILFALFLPTIIIYLI